MPTFSRAPFEAQSLKLYGKDGCAYAAYSQLWFPQFGLCLPCSPLCRSRRETLSPTGRDVNCGGKGLNQSIAAARVGAQVFHAGKIGPDGTILTDILKSSGVDVSLVTVSQEASGRAIIQVEPSGQNCILLFGGSNQEITHGEIDQALEGFGPGDYLILQNEISRLPYLMEKAAQKGLFIVFNPSPIDSTIPGLPLHQVSLLIFNEIEGTTLTGYTEPDGILDTLRARWPQCRFLLTLGGDGCVYDNGSRRLRQGIYRVKTVDTTAAGDTFTGYFVACLSAGMSEEWCLELAARAAVIAVSRSGAASSIPTMREVESAVFFNPEMPSKI